MNSLRIVIVAAALSLLGGPGQAQVFKCADASGKVTYSQAPCSGAGQLLDSRRPSSAPPAELTQCREVERTRRSGAGTEPPAPAAPAPARGHCLGAQEVRNMETAASSLRLGPLDRQVQAEQFRRAKSCEPLMTEAEMQVMKHGLRSQRRASRPTIITSCDPGGCWGSDGTRYASGGPNLVRQDGTVCVRTGDTLTCH